MNGWGSGRTANVARRALDVEVRMGMRRPLGIAAGMGFFVAALVSCDRARVPALGSGSDSGNNSEITAGSLVCPDTAAFGTLSAKVVPIQCPLLAVAVDSTRDSVRLIGPADRDYRIPMSALRLLGPARIPDGLTGATDSVVERMAPGPNPGVLTSQSDFGLLFRNASGTLDTVFPGDLPASKPAVGGGVRDIEACLDSLEASPAYGLLFPPFAPDLDCGGGSAGQSQGTPWKSAFSLKALAKPRHIKAREKISAAHSSGGRNWIFLLTGDMHFVWRVAGGKAQILEAPFMENSGLESIAAYGVDGDSILDLILEVKTHDGDGFYNTLYVLNGVPLGDGDKSPRIGSIGLDGSSAEADGSTVESDWWIRSPYIYHAYAQSANSGGRASSHDTRLDAYRFSDSGGFSRTKPDFSYAVFFGPLGSKREAQGWCDSLSAKQSEAARADMRPLPRLTPDGIFWQAGALAANLGTAKLWSGWDPSGKVVSLSFGPGRD